MIRKIKLLVHIREEDIHHASVLPPGMHVHLPVAVKAVAIHMEYDQVTLENKSESSMYGKNCF